MPIEKDSFIVNQKDIAKAGGLTESQVNALIATALADYAKKADVYTKTESDAKYQPKA